MQFALGPPVALRKNDEAVDGVQTVDVAAVAR